MHQLLFDPDYWRGRAMEARTIAKQTPHAMLKRRMQRIAEDYDNRANLSEKQRGMDNALDLRRGNSLDQ